MKQAGEEKQESSLGYVGFEVPICYLTRKLVVRSILMSKVSNPFIRKSHFVPPLKSFAHQPPVIGCS